MNIKKLHEGYKDKQVGETDKRKKLSITYTKNKMTRTKLSIKPVFHFNRIVAKRSVFHCFVNSQAELVIWAQ